MPIPEHVSTELLMSCRHACCICGGQFLQIHHIDGDKKNHDSDNLIPLCKKHHDEVHSVVPMTRKITPAQLKCYRNKWIAGMNKFPELFAYSGHKELELRVAYLEQIINVGVNDVET